MGVRLERSVTITRLIKDSRLGDSDAFADIVNGPKELIPDSKISSKVV